MTADPARPVAPVRKQRRSSASAPSWFPAGRWASLPCCQLRSAKPSRIGTPSEYVSSRIALAAALGSTGMTQRRPFAPPLPLPRVEPEGFECRCSTRDASDHGDLGIDGRHASFHEGNGCGVAQAADTEPRKGPVPTLDSHPHKLPTAAQLVSTSGYLPINTANKFQ